MEIYISEQICCLRFLDSYMFLPISLDKLVKSLKEFLIIESLNLTDELLKQKLAYPYDNFNLQNMHEPLRLNKQNYWSTLTQTFASDNDIDGTEEIINTFIIKPGNI